MKKINLVLMSMLAIVLSSVLAACSFKKAEATFSQSEIVVSLEDTIKLDEYLSVKNIEKNEVSFKYSNSSLFEAKGISNEITLPVDIVNKYDLYNYLSYLSEKVSLRIKSDGKYANVVCVILKDNLFKRRSHQVKVKNPIRDSSDIFAVSKRLLNEMWRDGDMIRLIGIRLDDLVCDYKYQMSLFDNNDRVDGEKIDKVLSDINKKLGYDAVKKCNMSIK